MKNLIFLLIILSFKLYSQTEKISFNQLIKKLEFNFKLKDNISSAKIVQQFRNEINNTGYLPQFNLIAQATYQSDVIKIPINLPGIKIPTMDKDQYKIALEVNQIIYDGAMISTQNKKDKILSNIDTLQAKINLVAQKDMLNKLVYMLLINQKTKFQLLEHKKLLLSRQNDILFLIKSGILQESDLFSLKVEIVKIDQQIDAIDAANKQIYKNIEALVGENIENKEIIYDEEALLLTQDIKRIELFILDEKQRLNDISVEFSSNQNLPKIYAFGQFGYGKPGLNMLSDKFDTYYLIGIGVKWNLLDWGKSNKENEIAKINKNSIQNEKELFIQSINIQANEILSSIEKLDKWIEKDKEIIELKDKILFSTNSKLSNGVAKATDYLNDLNSKTQSLIDYEKHKIEKQYYIQSYKILMGMK